MGWNKKHDGYKAYQYLDESDYRMFELTSEEDSQSYLVPLSEEQEKRALKLMEESIIISLHEHPCLYPKDITIVMEYKHEGRQPAAYEWLSKSCLDAVFDNLMDGTCIITSKHGWKWEDIIFDLGMRLCDLAHQSFVIRCEKVDDIIKAHNEGKLALVPTLEGAAMIENEVDRLDILYGLGIRSMGVVYSESNALGSGIKEKNDGGLTTLGREAVERMNKLGIAIDCSHVGDQTTIDIIRESKQPVLISHTGARELWNSKRLKPDYALKACADKGGLIGIEAAPHTTITVNNTKHSIESFMEHFEYIKDLVGIDYVSFGPDTIFGDHVGLHHAFRQHLSIKSTQQTEVDFEKVEYVKGLENPTEASINIVRWLVKHNYSDDDIKKVIGGNSIRVLKEIWY
jgi:membrane dipeptidase